MARAAAAESNPALSSTTVYVSSQFEVRNHDQPTKFVFNGSTRVASIIGSLSTNSRIQRLRLSPGWNLVALAVSAKDLAGQLQQSGPGVVSAVYQWVATTGQYAPVVASDTIAAGAILWINATTNANVGIVGTYTDPPTPQVPAGGGYVPGSGLEAWMPLLPLNVSGWFYDSFARQWREQLAAPIARDLPWTLAPGQAMFVKNDSAANLAGPDPSLRIRYYHEDHLGSSAVITDQAGNLVEESTFYPFGHTRNAFQPRQSHDPYQFEQKERDSESGLSYFNSRFLSDNLARFTRVDPLAGNPPVSWLESPQSLNPYSYVVNNPLKLVDPTGKGPEDPDALKAKTRVLVMYGNSQFQDFAKFTHNTSRGYFEQQLKATYAQEGGKNAEYVVVDISKMSKDEFKKFFKDSSYDVAVYDGHGSSNKKQKMILPEGKLGYLTPDDLAEAVHGAKSAPKQFYFYGCNTAASGFARQLSEDLPDTDITGSGARIAPYYTHGQRPTVTEDRDHNITFKGGKETKDVRKVNANDWTLSR
jgi:RHS repeat-associated protein